MNMDLNDKALEQILGGGKWTNTFIGAMDGAALGFQLCGPWCGVAGGAIGSFIGYNAP